MRRIWSVMIAMMCGSLSATAAERAVVAVTTYPLYEVFSQVGGDAVELRQLLPAGTDVHTFRPTPKTMIALGNAVLFVYSGAGLEPWSEDLAAATGAHTRIVDMSREVHLIEGEHDAHEGHGHHDAEGADPHYWLDIENMSAMTRKADALLGELFPSRAKDFHENAERYTAELQRLEGEYREGLQACKQHYLVSNHDAFGYLAHAFGFESRAVTGLSPDQQPSARVMADVIDLVRREQIKTIVFEAFVSDSVARTLAAECGVETAALQPLANLAADEAAAGETYLSIMRRNLQTLRRVLECR